MAPKGKPVDKNKQAAKSKAAEDKTFGLKNKNKSAKVQKYVATVTTQVPSNKDQRLAELAKQEKAKRKAAEEERKRELAELFSQTIKQPKVPAGVDPKSMVCEFFRHGQCTKGSKCKFSHDLEVERKTAKIDLFTDMRQDGGEGGNMEDWDQETLEKVVAEKHAGDKPSTATTIICKFFLDAVERKQYGWFWKCPNGADCKYRHALPAGYVLKSQMKELLEAEAAAVVDVTEQIEEARAAVVGKTPVTEETFRAWQAARKAAKLQAREDADAERKRKGILNGREIFLTEGFTATDDASASGADDYRTGAAHEEERAIQEMFEQARRNQEAARQRDETAAAADGGAAAAAGSSGSAHDPGPSGSGGGGGAEGGAANGTHLRLADDEREALFGDDDDGDEEDDEDDGDLEALEAAIQGASVS